MRKGRQTQVQRIANLEESVTKLYMMVQAIIEKVTKEDKTEDKK